MTTTRFEDKRVLITGAASGIGAATLALFQREGAHAIGLDINVTGDLLRCDVAEPRSVDDAIRETIARLGGLDVCVNVAGVGGFAALDDLTLDDWQRIFAVNVTGPMLVTKAALPHLRASTGNVVSVASISGMQGQPYNSAYCASKAALLLFMKSIAVELASSGIRVNCVCPGGVGKMPGIDNLDDAAAILPPGVDPMMFIRLNGVLPGITEQHDIAEAIAYLASDAARSVSGTALLVDRVTLW